MNRISGRNSSPMKKIIHIAPALPPAVNGLGDFCKILADNLEREGFNDNVFMIRQGLEIPTDERIDSFNSQNFYDKLESRHADVLILHYVGYGYNKRGLPFYLVGGLRRYKRMTGCRLLIFFHELYASSDSLFELAFYTSGMQKLLVKRLSEIADTVFTSCLLYSDLLRKLLGNRARQPVCTGIFSNIPDNLYDSEVPKEKNSIVVFGSLEKRNAVYHHKQFEALMLALRIKTLYDIGPGLSDCQFPSVKVVVKGTLHAAELASYFNRIRFGALSYPPHLLGKSGIFSAYAAFGVIPFNLPVDERPLYDGLIAGKNYFSWTPGCTGELFNDGDAKDEILKWYHTHDQRKIVETFKAHL